MITYRNLQEALNRPYRWKRGLSSNRGWNASFKVDKNQEYNFRALKVVDRWEVVFWLNDSGKGFDDESMGVTGTAGGSGALRVFSTIVQIFEVFVKEVEPIEIKFSADKTESTRTTRAKLYHRFAKRFAKEYGYKLKMKDNVIDVDFIFQFDFAKYGKTNRKKKMKE